MAFPSRLNYTLEPGEVVRQQQRTCIQRLVLPWVLGVGFASVTRVWVSADTRHRAGSRGGDEEEAVRGRFCKMRFFGGGGRGFFFLQPSSFNSSSNSCRPLANPSMASHVLLRVLMSLRFGCGPPLLRLINPTKASLGSSFAYKVAFILDLLCQFI